MSKWLFIIHFVAVLLFACTSSNNTQEEETSNEVVSSEDYYTIMTAEQAQELFSNADKVDVLFNDIAVSLSQVKQSDVQGQISFLKPGLVPKKLDCSETANIIFQAKGEIVADGRMYLRGDCRYVIFYEENQPVYATQITDQGMNFYRRVLAAGNSTVKQ